MLDLWYWPPAVTTALMAGKQANVEWYMVFVLMLLLVLLLLQVAVAGWCSQVKSAKHRWQQCGVAGHSTSHSSAFSSRGMPGSRWVPGKAVQLSVRSAAQPVTGSMHVSGVACLRSFLCACSSGC